MHLPVVLVLQVDLDRRVLGGAQLLHHLCVNREDEYVKPFRQSIHVQGSGGLWGGEFSKGEGLITGSWEVGTQNHSLGGDREAKEKKHPFS